MEDHVAAFFCASSNRMDRGLGLGELCEDHVGGVEAEEAVGREGIYPLLTLVRALSSPGLSVSIYTMGVLL